MTKFINLDGKKLKAEKISPSFYVTDFVFTDNDHAILSTRFQGIIKLDLSIGKVRVIEKTTGINFYNLMMDNTGGIWASSDQGALLLDMKQFINVSDWSDEASDAGYIIKVERAGKNGVFFADENNLYRADRVTGENRIIKTNVSGLIRNFSNYGEGIWLSMRSGKIINYSYSAGIKFEHIFDDDRAHQLVLGSEKKLWGFLETSRKIFTINRQNHIEFISTRFPANTAIASFDNTDGEYIYIALQGTDQFLYKLSKITETVSPLPIRGEAQIAENFIVNQTAQMDNGDILLATNHGVFKYADGEMLPICLKNSEGKVINNITSVVVMGDGKQWYGTSSGIMVVDGDKTAFYNRDVGLPGSGIIRKGLVTDESGILWAATASGLSFLEQEEKLLKPTTTPVIKTVRFSRKGKDFKGEDNAVSGSNLFIEYSSPDFPSFNTVYELILETDDEKITRISKTGEAHFPKLATGTYKFSVRARKPGKTWSEFEQHSFTIIPPWYLSDWMIIFYFFLTISVVALIFNRINEYRFIKMAEKEKELTGLVEIKTEAIRKQKEKIEELLFESEKDKAKIYKTSELKSEILAIAAHDLKNPLQSIMWSADVLAECSKEEADEFIEIIKESSVRMHDLIIGLLEKASHDVDDLRLNFKRSRIDEILNEVIKANIPNASKKGQKLKTEIEENIEADVDRRWFRIAVENLLSNAIKFSPQQGNIELKLKRANDHIQIDLGDDGPGFTEDDKKKLFGKFQKLSANPTGGETSTGLGLFIVKDIVEKTWRKN